MRYYEKGRTYRGEKGEILEWDGEKFIPTGSSESLGTGRRRFLITGAAFLGSLAMINLGLYKLDSRENGEKVFNPPNWMPPVADKYWKYFNRYGNEFDVDPRLTSIMSLVESGFYTRAGSSKGAKGIMQIMPGTARGIAKELNLRNYNLLRPEDNIRMGTYYVSSQLNKFVSIKKAIWAYHDGPGNVQKGRLTGNGEKYLYYVGGMYLDSGKRKSEVYGDWLSAMEYSGGLTLKMAFDEQGKDYQAFIESEKVQEYLASARS